MFRNVCSFGAEIRQSEMIMGYNRSRNLIWGIIIVVMLLALNSCSKLLSGPQEQDTTYFAPNFFQEKIVALRNTWGPEKDPFSGRSPYEYTILINETSQETPLFELYVGNDDGIIQIEISPTLSYIGILDSYKSTPTSEPTNLIRISTKEGETYSYYPYFIELKNDVIPTSFHFSPDESKLAVSFSNEKFIITNLQGTGTIEYTMGGNFIWKNNNEGFFYKKSSSKLAKINLENNEVTQYEADIVPMTYNASAEEIYSISGNTFEAYKLGNTEVTKKQLNFDPDKYVLPRISSDGKKVVMMVTPYEPPDGSKYLRGGIYLIDVSENVLKTVRYYTNEKIIPTKD